MLPTNQILVTAKLDRNLAHTAIGILTGVNGTNYTIRLTHDCKEHKKGDEIIISHDEIRHVSLIRV